MQNKLQELLDRLDANLAEFQTAWEAKSVAKLIDSSREITAIKDTHYYLSESHDFEPEEIDYLLAFENPLKVVSDKWLERTEDLSDFSFALNEVFHGQYALREYALQAKPSVLDQLHGTAAATPAVSKSPHSAKEVR